jgi:uroporphyrinogen-III synthase
VNGPLAGRRVLVTRPARQAAGLADLIRDAGGVPVVLPALDIVAVAPPPALPFVPDAVLFVSPNAAQYGWPLLASARSATVYAVGPGTARTLTGLGAPPLHVPDGQDSEALLALPGLAQVAGKKLLIVRGVGGRPLLADTLAARGAEVAYLECYERRCPTMDAATILARWHDERLDAVTIASLETWHCLTRGLGEAGAGTLRATPVFAPHAKIAAALRDAGVVRAIATAGGDAGLVAGLIHWFRTLP